MSPRKADPPALEYVLLGLIRLHPSHGYEMFHSLHRDEGIGMIWQVKPAHLYALLDKLEQMGWLDSHVQTGEGFLPRKTYRITSTGEQVFQNWMNRPVSAPHRMRQEFLARLYFVMQGTGPQGTGPQDTGPQVTVASMGLIGRQMEACQRWQKDLQIQLERLPTGAAFERQVLHFRLGQIQAMQEWLIAVRASFMEQES